jgi:hypothetical protein
MKTKNGIKWGLRQERTGDFFLGGGLSSVFYDRKVFFTKRFSFVGICKVQFRISPAFILFP